MVIEHTFNPSSHKAEAQRISEFETSMVYRVSFRIARAVTQRTLASKRRR